jgi:putative oxidoreductase
MKTGRSFKSQILNTGDDTKMVFLRLIVGFIFISEGLQKYLFLQFHGPSLFQEIGFAHAFFWAYLTGAFEIICGIMILVGLLTRLASVPLLIIMITAFITTKLPLLYNRGFWTFTHEYSIDFSLTILLILLLIYGGGKWSVDLNLLNPENKKGVS